MASGVEDAPGIKCLGFIQNFQAEFLFSIFDRDLSSCKSVGKIASEFPP